MKNSARRLFADSKSAAARAAAGGVIMLKAPEIDNSSVEERRAFIKAKYPCIADCDMCGLCKVFRGKNAEQAYDDYITGKRSFMDVSADYRRV